MQMNAEVPTWAIVVPQSAENKEELLRKFVRQLRGLCCGEGVELPRPFVYLWEDVTQDTLAGLTDFVNNLLRGIFDFVLCICNTDFDSGQHSQVGEDQPSAEHSTLYLTFEKVESSFSVVENVLRTMSTCFARRLGLVSEGMVLSSHLTLPRRPLRTFMSRTTNAQDDFLIIAKDGISIATSKQAAYKSYRLSHLILEEGKASEPLESVDVRPLLLAVQWLEYSNSSRNRHSRAVDRRGTLPGDSARNACSCCKPNVYQARLLDYNKHWWWDLITASDALLGLMHGALAERLANVAPPSCLKDLYDNSRGSSSSRAPWSKVASSFGSIPMPSEVSDGVLLNVVRSYSSRYPSLQWAEEFASVSPQWKQVIDTNRDELPRLFVETVKVRGSQLEIWLQANDPQPSAQPIILNDQAATTAAMLRRLAANSLIISLEEHETLEEVLVYVGRGGLRATSVSLVTSGILDHVNVKQIMRAINVAERMRVEVKWARDIEALMSALPRHVGTFEMDLDSCSALDKDTSLDLLLYFANRTTFRDFVIERYRSDMFGLASRISKKFSCGIASRLNMLVTPTEKTPSMQEVQTTIALTLRRPDGHRFVAVREGCGMRMVIGKDWTVNKLMSGRKDYNTLLPLLNRGSSEFEQLQKAVYETLFSQAVGYSDLHQLLQDVKKDYDIDGEQATRRFAYESFTDFLQSAEMKAKVNISEDSSERKVYEAIPTADNMHLRWEQQKSAVSVAERSAKKARNEASDARKKVAELERRQRDLPDLERRVRELELQVRQRDETIRQKSAALAEAESKIECFCCKDRPIEVSFNCGHGACRDCTEQLTTEERIAPGTNQFRVNEPKIRVRKADPKCSQCGESVDPCRPFYALRS